MPAVATWGDIRVEAWSLTDGDWLDLRETYREKGLTMTCGQLGVPVDMKGSGTRFFRHKTLACGLHEGGQESMEHLKTKMLVAEVARSLGWEATIEAPAPDRSWIADVLLQKGDLKLAIEVQWAAQTEQEFHRRTERYERDGLVCHWLVGPKNHGRAPRISTTDIGGTDGDLTMTVPSGLGGTEQVPLVDGLRILLNGSLQPRYDANIDEVEIATAMRQCYRYGCNAWFSSWFVRAVGVETTCGLRGTLRLAYEYPVHATSRLPEMILQEDVTRAINYSDLPEATHYRRAESKTVGHYIAQGCPRCGAFQGDGFIASQPRWVTYKVPIEPTWFPFGARITTLQHQCIDQGQGRCDQEVASKFRDLPYVGEVTLAGSIDGDPLPPRRQRPAFDRHQN